MNREPLNHERVVFSLSASRFPLPIFRFALCLCLSAGPLLFGEETASDLSGDLSGVVPTLREVGTKPEALARPPKPPSEGGAKTESSESAPDTALPDKPVDLLPPSAPSGNAGESAGEEPSAIKPAELPVLHEGDDIEVFVSEDASFNGVYKIRQGGYVVIPQVGQFMVAGKTQPEAQKALKERLEQNFLKKATVAIMVSTAVHPSVGGVVYVIGEVSKPGLVQIPQNETLTMLTAVLRAGALGDHADPGQVQLARLKGGRRDISIMNFDAVLKGYEAGTELALQDGDIVNVIGREGIDLQKEPPPSRGTVYLNGRVKEPGPHDIKDLTVFRTLLRYGGFDRFANLKKVYVLRMEHGSQLKIPVNIKAIRDKAALDLDIPVKPGDIIVVPEKFFSF